MEEKERRISVRGDLMDEFFVGKEYKKTLIKGSEIVNIINSIYDVIKCYDEPVSIESARGLVKKGLVKDIDTHLSFNTCYEENEKTYGGCSLLFYDSSFNEDTLEYRCQKTYKSKKNVFGEDVIVEQIWFSLYTDDLKISVCIYPEAIQIYIYAKNTEETEHEKNVYLTDYFDDIKFPLKEESISDFYILDDSGWRYLTEYLDSHTYITSTGERLDYDEITLNHIIENKM